MSSIKILKAGLFTTVQDAGRTGYQKFGIPVAGVMDSFSYKIANFLVGNDEKEAVLEATFLGPELEFSEEMIVAVTGADMKPKLNEKDIPMWQSFKVVKGDKLSLGAVATGLRTYIAFGGDLGIELINNSKSTFVKSQIGGYKGRKLMTNDEISIKTSKNSVPGRFMDKKYIPDYRTKEKINVVLGPQDDYFTDEGIKAFFNPNGYKITKDADRMGYRLEGEVIKHKDKADIISDGAMFGSIQVPANGQPIILMADRQTTGGYTKIATVISTELPVLAQMGVGSEVVFERVSLEEAHDIYRQYEKFMKEIKLQIYNSPKHIIEKTEKLSSSENSKKMKVVVNGKEYMVSVQRIS